MKNFLIFILALVPACADDLIEFRSASRGEYRYADWSHTFANKMATDVTYIGVPGNNEFNACLGYTLPSVVGFTATPFFCGTAAKEDKELGVKAAAVISFERGHLKGDVYYARFQPLRGSVSSYDVLDAGNLVWGYGRKLNPKSSTRRWESGLSTGFFRQDGKWNPQYGPLLRRNDHLGFWGVSFRTGSDNELRVIRTFIFTKR